MSKWLSVILLLFISCFEFESPYEDLNGIYLQLIKSYNYSGEKLLIEGQKGYLLRRHSFLSSLRMFDLAKPDLIYEISNYVSYQEIANFEVCDGYAYCVLPSYGIEIVNFNDSIPYLYSTLEITGSPNIIRLLNHYAFVAGDSNFYVIDIQNRTDPDKVFDYNFNRYIKCFEIDSNYAYVLLSNSDICILDIRNPASPELISEIVNGNILPMIELFTLKNNYLYVLRVYHEDHLETYEISEEYNIERLSKLYFPGELSFIYAGDKYGLALHMYSEAVYLLNLDYPSQPCISEIIYLETTPDYGIINDNLIYVLTPYMNVIEIKEIIQ